MFPRKVKLSVFCSLMGLIIVHTNQVYAASDVYVRDTLVDTGAEPYSGPGPIYNSPDIWVRNEPDPNHEPYPFPTSSPTWTPLTHQNPEYRDSKTGQPNYVYVRVHNRGDLPTIGNERLRLYQAKASTGLSWPNSWVDNVGPACGADRLQGIEVTKPRLNAQTVTDSERNAYRDALLAIQTDPQFQYSDGAQYWRKQNQIHATAGNPEHGNPAFLSWHREMMNRLEERLRESNPLVTLLYWDWTVDPRVGTNLFSPTFLGEGNGTVAAPLIPLRPPTLTRNVGLPVGSASPCFPGRDPDATVIGTSSYPTLRDNIESVPNHDCAHGYIGGGGQMSFLNSAAQDPFFFFLHSNVDRLWATWQRAGASPLRIDPVATYGANSSNFSINRTMSPWDGGTGMAPWTGAAAYDKTSKHRSVVYPPIYDTAPLNIPILQPNESVIVEIPWFPPNVNDFDCAGQAGHFCLLARIETSTTAPFGMTVAEGMNVGSNTTNNNNIAWKNLEIVDNISEPALMMTMGTSIRNIFDRETVFQIGLHDRTEKRRFMLGEFTTMALVLPKEIAKRIETQNGHLHDLTWIKDRKSRRSWLEVTGKEPRFSVVMRPNETFNVQFTIDIKGRKMPKQLLEEVFYFDLEQQLDLPKAFFEQQNHTALEVGGVRFALDFTRASAKPVKESPADLQLKLLLQPDRMLLIPTEQAQADITHLSVGEPVDVIVNQKDGNEKIMNQLMIEVDGDEITNVQQIGSTQKTVSFDTPGIHRIVTRGIDEDGKAVIRSTRVLVSENIPPNALITSPQSGARFKMGDVIEVTVETAASFGSTVDKVSLYVKDNDEIATGLDLVRSPNYQPISTATGPQSHQFQFKPEKPGMYMFQIGVLDDQNITGVSRHVMVMVTE